MVSWGEPEYRGKQIYSRLYVRCAFGVDQMSELPKELRQRLSDTYACQTLRLTKLTVCDQGLTRKALFTLPDGSPLETVLMVYSDRATVCVSSQSGCPMACTFCATGKLGFLHDLSTAQIIEQVMWAEGELQKLLVDDKTGGLPRFMRYKKGRRLTNVVFMGMGEPFNNYRNWWEAVKTLNDPNGYQLGARQFTVSTVGLVPGIVRLSEERIPINLAISLHAPDDELRNTMMPVNKRYPLDLLLDAALSYVKRTHRRVSFEYVLLQKQNDSPEHGRALSKLLRKFFFVQPHTPCHVNLIPWNPVPGSPLSRSNRERVCAFQRVLQEHRIPCTVRVERGLQINAACGQLAGDFTEQGSPRTLVVEK